VTDVMRMIKDREDVKRVIEGSEAESAGLRTIMRYGSLSDLQRTNCEFHLHWNAGIVEKLTQFLLAPTEFGSPTEFGR
jgi:hypothetical protein